MNHPSFILKSFAGLVTFGFFWGATQPLTKIAVSTGYQPFGLIFWQLLIAVVLIGIVLLVLRIRVPFGRRHLVYFTGVSLLGTLIPNSFSYLAAAKLPAGIMAVAISTVPMFSLMIALGVGNERFAFRRSMGILLGVTAMMMIALPEASLPVAGQGFWVFVALIAPFCYGLEGNFVAKLVPPKLNPMAALWGASFLGMLAVGPLALASGQFINPLVPFGPAEWALVVSSIAHAVAYSGFMWLIGFAGIVFSTQIAYVVTMAAILIAIVFLGEVYSGWVWMAIGLMLSGLLLVQPVGKLPEDDGLLDAAAL